MLFRSSLPPGLRIKCKGADRILQLAIDAKSGREADVVTYGDDGKPNGFHSFSKAGS